MNETVAESIPDEAEAAAPVPWPDHATYGWRARLGLIVSPANTANEAEWQRVLPDGITLHVTRMAPRIPPSDLLASDLLDDDEPMSLDLQRAAGDLAPAGVGAIAYGCSAGSMMTPLERLPRLIRQATGIPGVTTAGAVVEALRFYGGKTIAIAAPYHDDVVASEAAFLRSLGFRVVSSRGLGVGAEADDIARQRSVSPSLAYAQARKTVVDGTDVLFLADTDMPTLGIIDALEADLGIPVISSNQAALWATLRAARVRVAIAGWGRLLATPL